LAAVQSSGPVPQSYRMFPLLRSWRGFRRRRSGSAKFGTPTPTCQRHRFLTKGPMSRSENCARPPDIDSMLLSQIRKILLQQYRTKKHTRRLVRNWRKRTLHPWRVRWSRCLLYPFAGPIGPERLKVPHTLRALVGDYPDARGSTPSPRSYASERSHARMLASRSVAGRSVRCWGVR
jgi:hypothetical protein